MRRPARRINIELDEGFVEEYGWLLDRICKACLFRAAVEALARLGEPPRVPKTDHAYLSLLKRALCGDQP